MFLFKKILIFQYKFWWFKEKTVPLHSIIEVQIFKKPNANIKNEMMSYNEMAQLDVLNVVRGINSETDYLEFRNLLAQYFSAKAQKAIDAMWEKGEINEQTIEDWGKTKMRTPYRYALHRS